MDLQKADSKEYLEFIDKFAPKTTTDDCFTPPLVYDAVRDWVCKEYGVDKDKIVRPFYPGGDYQNFYYSNGAVVVDNPPFSILSKICTHYLDECIPFFLFAPALTCLSGKELVMNVCHVMTGSTITYANGATVETAYVTNLDDPDLVIRTAPDLSSAIKVANETHLKEKKESFAKEHIPGLCFDGSDGKHIRKPRGRIQAAKMRLCKNISIRRAERKEKSHIRRRSFTFRTSSSRTSSSRTMETIR